MDKKTVFIVVRYLFGGRIWHDVAAGRCEQVALDDGEVGAHGHLGWCRCYVFHRPLHLFILNLDASLTTSARPLPQASSILRSKRANASAMAIRSIVSTTHGHVSFIKFATPHLQAQSEQPLAETHTSLPPSMASTVTQAPRVAPIVVLAPAEGKVRLHILPQRCDLLMSFPQPWDITHAFAFSP
ncbi:hypothetical protein CPC08DRAFT_767909 [Agrocybe pediades]|nr:hypothetical protein CPC08DRAFT_767909 [Agrocybe pediades]